MNIKHFLFSIIVVCTFAFQSSFAIFNSFAVWTVETPHGPVEVLVLGEYHYVYAKEQVDIPHTEQFKKAITRWCDGNKKTKILVEQTEKDFQSFLKGRSTTEYLNQATSNNDSPDHSGILYEISLFLHELDSNKISYAWSDMRNRFGKFVTLLVKMGAGRARCDCEDCSPGSVGEYYAEIQSALKYVKAFKKTLDPLSPEFGLFYEYEQSIKLNGLKARLFFNQIAKAKATTSCAHIIKTTLAKYKGAFAPNNPLYFSHYLMRHIADAGFIIDLIKSMEHYDRIVFAGGNAHAIALNRYLKKLEKAGRARCKGFVGALDVKSTGRKLDPIAEPAMKHLFDVANSEQCGFCNKPAHEQGLKRCGHCQAIKYCSRDCQAQDWKSNHKTICTQLIEGRERLKVTDLEL